MKGSMELASALPDGWSVWSEEAGRAVVVYRPDVFDSEAFPPPCLPTLYLTKGSRGRRPGRPEPAPDDPWYVTLSLEPDVTADRRRFDDRKVAVEETVELARAFADGEFDYRSLYQVPRDRYLDELDELTGRETNSTG
ncbi:Uncharacterized protein HSR121_1643 [Halapricum desulfuricans]|uniref:Uncharacterized protein n=2 Tax=Halapricum desulfuricans TaxID=2841257 RepID=A0A897MV20_9EURY|nr:Uncharacterized protein HSR121_1643 [Halapricum desulfuricans]